MGINELQSFLKNKYEAIIIFSPVNRLRFTGFASSDGYLVVTKDDAVLFVDSRYSEAAEKKVTDCRVQLFKKAQEDIKNFLKERKIVKAYTERNHISVSTADYLKTAFLPCRVTPSKRLESLIGKIRAVKTAEEVTAVKEAQRIAESAFENILNFIKAGVTEKQIALELDFYMLSHGAEAVSFETIVVSGAKSSMPHGVPDDNVVKEGDFVTMDFGAVVNGYHSDMTRTVAVGKVTDEMKKVYETVLSAQKKALEKLKAGVDCCEADKAARQVIEDAGYGEYFGHATGHGVGVEIHEGPTLAPGSKGKLEPGNIVTIEPGIYIPDKFGVRIEDMALITEDGYENLTSVPKELIIL